MNNTQEAPCIYCENPGFWLLIVAKDPKYWTEHQIGSQYFVNTRQAPMPTETPIATICGIHLQRAMRVDFK